MFYKSCFKNMVGYIICRHVLDHYVYCMYCRDDEHHLIAQYCQSLNGDTSQLAVSNVYRISFTTNVYFMTLIFHLTLIYQYLILILQYFTLIFLYLTLNILLFDLDT
jgi:hypothetical protein